MFNKKNNINFCILISFLTLILLYYPTLNISLNYFHTDDHLLIGKLSNLTDFNSVFNFIFNFEYFKFRPISNFQYVAEYFLFKKNYNAYIIYNILLVLIVNYIFLLLIYKKNNFLVCLVLSLVLVSSKFLTYSIWNITGSFEILAVIFFLLIIFSIQSGGDNKLFIIIMSTALIFTSERYLPFVACLPVIHYYNKFDYKLSSSIFSGARYSVVILTVYFLFRYLAGMPLIVGTQTDDIVLSFSFNQFLLHISKSYFEIFGFSTGPKYLTGFEFVDWVPFNALLNNFKYICGFFITFSLALISSFYLFFKFFFKSKIVVTFNFICFILILASSITFRLELRWLLPVYLMLLLIFSTCRTFDSSIGNDFNIRYFDRALFFSFLLISILNNIYYAAFFRSSLYFAEKLHNASLVELIKNFIEGYFRVSA